MGITRLFRVRIPPGLRAEFEEKFASISVDAVRHAEGLLDVSIHKPTRWTPDEYAMVSVWESEDALAAFAGADWREAVIPPGMARFVLECWVHHYDAW